MFYKGFGSKKQPEQDIAERATVDSDARLGFASSGKPGAIDVLVNASGRVNLGILEKYAETAGRSEFARFMRHPVLAGASIQAGVLALQRQQRRHEVNQTFVFKVDSDENAESVCEGLRHAIYPLIKEQGTHRARNIFTIGRISGNDLVIPDISISKRQAVLEIKQDGYIIRDCHSTNGTTVNGSRLDDKSRSIRDGDMISFARYEFTFLSPDSLYRRLTGQ